MKKNKIVSLFAGCGGLDLGFSQAGFDITWANEYDKTIWGTYRNNHKNTILDIRSICDIPSSDIPETEGIIGGPPCQSWSLAGAMRGANDSRGKLFWEYLRILKNKKPLFFLAENVPGILSRTHRTSFKKLLNEFASIGYRVNYKMLNSTNYGVPQKRSRVIIVGYYQDMEKTFSFPVPTHTKKANLLELSFDKSLNLKPIRTLKDAIGDLPNPLPAKDKNKTNGYTQAVPNNEYMNGSFSTIYMSRNRKKEWDEPSFTIQAGGRHAPLYPEANKMIKLGQDEWKFDENTKYPYRRLSVRECARVQTFPDDFVFEYKSVADGYKMVGNAVPVLLSKAIAKKIKADLKSYYLSLTANANSDINRFPFQKDGVNPLPVCASQI